MFWISSQSIDYKIERANLDGTDRKTIASGTSLKSPDDISVDIDNYRYHRLQILTTL